MKKLFLLLFIFITIQLVADEFTVKFFTYNPNSHIASRYPRLDQNKQNCALILIETRLRNIIFEADQGIVGDIKLKQGKFYLYVPTTVTTLKFSKEGFDSFEYTLPLSVRSSGVYDLNLDAIITEKPVKEEIVAVQEDTPPISEQTKVEEEILPEVENKQVEQQLNTLEPTVSEELPIEKKENITEKKQEIKVNEQSITKEEVIEETVIEKSETKEETINQESVETVEPKQEGTQVEKVPEQIVKEVVEEIPEEPVEDVMLINDIPLKTAPEIENMIFVQGGCFNMGSHFGGKDELPVHKVCLDDFYIGKYEVTIEEYVEFLNGIACDSTGIQDNLKLISIGTEIRYENGIFVFDSKNAQLPVSTVTWYGAKAYAEWANARLLTEAEWEFAARGGLKMKQTLYAGSDSIYDVCMYAKSSGNHLHAVGSKAPNELGIFDMSGNVYEWVEDRYHKSYYAKSPEKNPQGSPFGQLRVMRGGSFGDKAADCRVANRRKYMPANSMYYFGFRIAKSLPVAEE